jgi:hypothetical protein
MSTGNHSDEAGCSRSLSQEEENSQLVRCDDMVDQGTGGHETTSATDGNGATSAGCNTQLLQPCLVVQSAKIRGNKNFF